MKMKKTPWWQALLLAAFASAEAKSFCHVLKR